MIINNSQNVVKDNKTIDTFNDFGKLNETIDFKNILQNKIAEMQANIEAGNVDFEPVFQIGGKAYTQEEWDKLLEYVDKVEEDTNEAMEEEQKKEEAEI